MSRAIEYIAYTLMAVSSTLYLILDLPPLLRGFTTLTTFVGAVVALFRSRTVDLRGSYDLAGLLDIIILSCLIIICLALISFGKVETARAPIMVAVVILVAIFLLRQAVAAQRRHR